MPNHIGRKWYTDFRFKGQRIRKVLPEARTADQAKRLEARLRDQYFEGSFGDPAAATVFIDFAEKVWLKWSREHKKSWKEDVRNLTTFRRFFGKRTFAEISSMLIEKFKRERKATPTIRGEERKCSSVNRELEALGKIFTLAMQHKITNENPCKRVKHFIENNARTRFLQPDEEARLIDALLLNPTLTTIVVMAIHTGMRRGEILKLEWRDVDFQAGQIHVRDTKTGHDRFIPINAKVRAELESLPREKAARWVFPGSGKTGHLVEIKKAWATALNLAGVENFKFHDLRHTAGSRLAAVGTHPMVMMELLGHRNLQTTKRYTHATDEAKRQAVAALEKFAQPSTTAEVIPFRQSG